MAIVGIYIGIQFLSNQQWKIANERLKQYKNDLSEAQAKIDSLQKALDAKPNFVHLIEAQKKIDSLQRALKAKPNAENSKKPVSNTTASTASAHPKQAQLNNYIKLCENATLPFADIDKMQKFVNDLKADAAELTNYHKLKDYADLYSRAYKVVCKILDTDYTSLDACINEGQPIRMDAAKYRDDLRAFRSGWGTLCIIHKGSETEDSVYLNEVHLNPNIIKNAKTFKSLTEIRTNWKP